VTRPSSRSRSKVAQHAQGEREYRRRVGPDDNLPGILPTPFEPGGSARRLFNVRRDAQSPLCLTYLAEYRGFIKWLVHNHIPFDIIVRPDAAELSRYQTVIVPSLVSVSDNNANLLRDYVFGGGNLIITKTGNA